MYQRGELITQNREQAANFCISVCSNEGKMINDAKSLALCKANWQKLNTKHAVE